MVTQAELESISQALKRPVQKDMDEVRQLRAEVDELKSLVNAPRPSYPIPRPPGRAAPLSYDPWERFMERTVYPPFDRFGSQTPFWSPLLSLDRLPEEDWRTYRDYWNELMRGPRSFMGRW